LIKIPNPDSLNIEHLRSENFEKLCKNEQEKFLQKMDLKAGIGMNYPLKENVFVIITCILN